MKSISKLKKKSSKLSVGLTQITVLGACRLHRVFRRWPAGDGVEPDVGQFHAFHLPDLAAVGLQLRQRGQGVLGTVDGLEAARVSLAPPG